MSPDAGRPIDLQKIFTPAEDSGEATPRRRECRAHSNYHFSIEIRYCIV